MNSVLLKISLLFVFCVVLSRQQTCNISYNKDISLQDLSPSYGQPQENCCGICCRTPGCKGFAWNTHQGGTCWLKSGTTSTIDKVGVNIGILTVSSAQQTCNILYNKDISQLDLPPSYGQPQENCCGIFSRTPGCKAFAWNTHQGGTCWLKSGNGPIIDMIGVNVGILSGTTSNNNGNGALITFDEFANGVVISNGYPRPTVAQYNAFLQGLPRGQITSKQEAAMALTQFLHESDGLRAKREYRCQDSGCPGEYEVANCGVAGQRYFGRGFIQLSWCYNYRDASQDLFGDTRLISNPDMVATDENLAWNTAFWFWKVNVHNKVGVANGDFGATTRAINGGLECDNSAGNSIARHRYEMYGRIRGAWGLSGAGSERGCYN